MRLPACLLALTVAPLAWGQPAPAAASTASALPCRQLLTIGAGEAHVPAIPLTTCDFDVVIADGGGLALRPRAAAARTLPEVLGPRGRFFPAMLDAQLRIEPDATSPDLAGLPGGLLLASESARLVPEGHWRWFRNEHLLRWMPPAPHDVAQLPECRALAAQRMVLWAGSLDRRPGEVIAPLPWRPGHAPGFALPVPKACIGASSVSAGAPVAIDGQTGVMVVQPLRAGVPSPQPFTVSVQVAGLPVQGQVLAYEASRQPLVGSWTMQQGAGCAGDAAAPSSRFKFIEFAADGHFRARAVPFESRYDAWGQYSFDGNAGTFDLRIEGGNDTQGLQSAVGTAVVRAGDELAVSRVVFTPGAGDGACSWSLVRSR